MMLTLKMMKTFIKTLLNILAIASIHLYLCPGYGEAPLMLHDDLHPERRARHGGGHQGGGPGDRAQDAR